MIFFISLILLSQASGHMYMSNPPPRNYKGNQFVKSIDYDISAPITLAQFPCKNYAPLESTKTVQAGSNLQVTLAGEAPHNGGSCEFSVSYDQQTWVSLKTVLGDCMMPQLTYDVPIPATAPNGKVSFSWSWVNRSGNREFYQNCADITIVGGKDGGSFTGPKMVVANFAGFPTVAEDDNMSVIPGKELYDNRPNISISSNGVAESPQGALSNVSAPQAVPAPATLAIAEPQGQQVVVAQNSDYVPPVPEFPTAPTQAAAQTTVPSAPEAIVTPTTIAAIIPTVSSQVQPIQPSVMPQNKQPSVLPQVQPTQPSSVPQIQPTHAPAAKKCKHKSNNH